MGMRPLASDSASIAESTADTILPSYDESTARAIVPSYGETRRNASSARTAISGSALRPLRHASQGPQPSVTRRAPNSRTKSMTSADAVRRPPEHLSRRPSQLPPPSCNSPFEEHTAQDRPLHLRRQSSSAYDNRWHKPLKHADYDYHRLHGVSDHRMHARPEMDENGQPKRSTAARTMIAGAAVGVIAVAACNIM